MAVLVYTNEGAAIWVTFSKIGQLFVSTAGHTVDVFIVFFSTKEMGNRIGPSTAKLLHMHGNIPRMFDYWVKHDVNVNSSVHSK